MNCHGEAGLAGLLTRGNLIPSRVSADNFKPDRRPGLS